MTTRLKTSEEIMAKINKIHEEGRVMTSEEFKAIGNEIKEYEREVYERGFEKIRPQYKSICAKKGIPFSEEEYKKWFFGPNYSELENEKI